MGRGGIYFRQTLPSANSYKRQEVPEVVPQASGIQFKEIESANVTQMVDSSSAALLAEINAKANKPLVWPWILVLSICLFVFVAMFTESFWIYCLLIPLCCPSLTWAVYNDKLRKTVVLFYELEPQIEQAYQNLHTAFDSLIHCARFWHVDSKGTIRTTYDWKVNAGASALVKRRTAAVDTTPPPYFQCNISIPSILAGRRCLYFLPDRILVRDATGVGAVGFDQLEITSREERFIEDGRVPNDTKVVGKTWRYVNKKRDPDRRFNNNREIPIVLYEAILLASTSGLQELFQASRIGIGSQMSAAIKEMSSTISNRKNPPVEGDYIKCPCSSCGLHIEFPASAVGMRVARPGCGAETTLFRPGTLTT
jgi:hypothetical protein